MNSDLKKIKKYYGEDMMHYMRDNFSSILEVEGELSLILLNSFDKSKLLYEDLKNTHELIKFKRFINSNFFENKPMIGFSTSKSPSDLLSEAGYNLFECKTEEDIQSFKKYYTKGEELCTFKGGRLNYCHVFFAVKKDVDNIKREDFANPEREDEYGTSVISIQFTKDDTCMLSIKNRYNHKVINPDATFKNNLDNIIPGLTRSFEEYYGYKQRFINKEDFKEFVCANDGKYYKYNYECYGIYYCPNNVIVEYGIPKKMNKERYVVLDNFVLDLQLKKIVFGRRNDDSFASTIENATMIEVRKNGNNRKIIFKNTKEDIVVEINNHGQIVGYINNNINEIGDGFLRKNKTLEYLELNNVTKIGNDFLINNKSLKNIKMEKVENIGNNFLCDLKCGIEIINFPLLVNVGKKFLYSIDTISYINLPKLVCLSKHFMHAGKNKINFMNIENCKQIDDLVLVYSYVNLDESNFNNVEVVGNSFLMFSRYESKSLNMPNVKEIGDDVLAYEYDLKYVNIPRCRKVGKQFLKNSVNLKKVVINELEKIEEYSFRSFIVKNLKNYKKLSYEEKLIKIKKIFETRNKIDNFLKIRESIIQNIYSKRKILKK